MKNVILLRLQTHFDAAHQLRDYVGKCANLHGHRWKVVVTVAGEFDREGPGMLFDFGVLKNRIELLLPDHTFLNAQFDFKRLNPTAENIAVWLAESIEGVLPPEVALVEVEVFETDNSSAIYRKGGDVHGHSECSGCACRG